MAHWIKDLLRETRNKHRRFRAGDFRNKLRNRLHGLGSVCQGGVSAGKEAWAKSRVRAVYLWPLRFNNQRITKKKEQEEKGDTTHCSEAHQVDMSSPHTSTKTFLISNKLYHITSLLETCRDPTNQRKQAVAILSNNNFHSSPCLRLKLFLSHSHSHHHTRIRRSFCCLCMQVSEMI